LFVDEVEVGEGVVGIFVGVCYVVVIDDVVEEVVVCC